MVVSYSSMEGDTGKNLVPSQGGALVVREYLVENFGFDDSQLKTLGMGKKTGTSPENGWGAIEINRHRGSAREATVEQQFIRESVVS